MASRTIIELVDDLDGSPASETVVFGYRGRTFEIDLSSANASALDNFLSRYVDAARAQGGRSASRGATGPTHGVPGPTRRDPLQTKAIKEWARANNLAVADRGRIAQSIVEAYETAH